LKPAITLEVMIGYKKTPLNCVVGHNCLEEGISQGGCGERPWGFRHNSGSKYS